MIRRRLAILERRLRQNIDLLVVWVGLIAYQPLVPTDHFFGRDDLAPWLTLTLSIVAFLRARPLGAGPHPMLQPRSARLGSLFRRIALAIPPWTLLLLYEGAATAKTGLVGASVASVGAIAILLALGRKHEQTSWNPPGPGAIALWLVGALVLGGFVGTLGWLCGAARGDERPLLSLPGWVGTSGLVAMGFLLVGLVAGRTRHLRQRRSAGLRDGRSFVPPVFPSLLAIGGPGVGLVLLYALFRDNLDFDMAYVGSLHVLIWAAVLWPRPEPVARACLLHEVMPAGGGDKEATASALSFERPPEGALRVNPLRTRRMLVMHPWVVPVRRARIDQLDDPIRPLWPQRPPPLPNHVLGEAVFEPDPLTHDTQWDVVTLKLGSRQDVSAVARGAAGAQTRRIVVLRPFPRPGSPRRRRLATYRWENAGPQESIQVLDATVDTATLMDGDLLVVSAEGVARVFEVELGTLLYSPFEAERVRPAQLEDYVKVGG